MGGGGPLDHAFEHECFDDTNEGAFDGTDWEEYGQRDATTATDPAEVTAALPVAARTREVLDGEATSKHPTLRCRWAISTADQRYYIWNRLQEFK